MERPRFDLVASGQRMKSIRQQRKISVRQVMEYMGFESTQAIYKWEAGKCYPQADNLVALAFLYCVSPSELLVEEDNLSSSFILPFFVLTTGSMTKAFDRSKIAFVDKKWILQNGGYENEDDIRIRK